MEMTKDIEFNGVKYQINKLPASKALFLATQLFTKIMPGNIEQDLNINNLPANRQMINEEDFDKIINYCMMASKKYEMVGTIETPMPIIMQNGRWAIPELEYDHITVIALVINVLAFNIKAFFENGVLNELKKSFQGLSLFSTPQ